MKPLFCNATTSLSIFLVLQTSVALDSGRETENGPSMEELAIEFVNRGAPASEKQIVAFERRHKLRLPDEYRAFLKQSNGAEIAGGAGIPIAIDPPFEFIVEKGMILNLSRLLSLEQIESNVMFDDGLKAQVIPIGAEADQHHLIALGIDGARRGTIYFWVDVEDQSIGFDRLSIKLADSLGEYLIGLKPYRSATFDETRQNKSLEYRLAAAVCNSDAARVKELLEQDVDPNVPRREPPLGIAACLGSVRLSKLLLDKGADPNLPDANGRTPLHCAGSLDAATLLLKRGAKIDVQDNEGLTPLAIVSRFSDLRPIRLLLANGANPNLLSKEGRTALDEAHRDNPRNTRLHELLRNHGAKRAMELK